MAGRTFFIPKETQMSQALESIANDIDTTPKAPPTPLTAALTEILAEPITSVRGGILASFTSSLNLQLVTRCREAIRQRAREHTNQVEVPTLDERNEADDAAGANSGCYEKGTIDEANAAYAGNPLPMSAAQVAQRLGIIRSFCHMQQESLRTNNIVPFVPRPLTESVDWLLTQLPINSKPTDPAVLVAMELTGMSAEQCVAVRNAGHASERAELEAMAPEMVALGELLTSAYKPDAQAVEEAFDSLPPQIMVNIYISAINACVSSYNNSFKRVVMRGDAAAAGDMVIAKALYTRGLTTLSNICTKHAAELSEFESRGGMLKEVKRIG
jgi:hypothetical protein